ncbi:MAG: MarR family transcriptional regulator [Bacilli bacterium]
MSRLRDSLNDMLVNIFNHITTLEGVTLKKMGIKVSMNEVHIIEAIHNNEIPTMTNVASMLLITAGSLTTAVEKLVQKGYVIRYQEENDRRKVLLKLTAKGEEVIKIHDIFHDEMIENTIKDMHLDEESELIPILENLSDYFRKKYQDRIESMKSER